MGHNLKYLVLIVLEMFHVHLIYMLVVCWWIKIRWFDRGTTTGNTTYNGNNSLCITTNAGYYSNIGQFGGTGYVLTTNNNGITRFSILCTQKDQNSLVSYYNPNPQMSTLNSTTMSNLPCINICAGAQTSTQNNIEAYLIVFCADSYNATNNIEC